VRELTGGADAHTSPEDRREGNKVGKFPGRELGSGTRLAAAAVVATVAGIIGRARDVSIHQEVNFVGS
jgi:hypothetical protein